MTVDSSFKGLSSWPSVEKPGASLSPAPLIRTAKPSGKFMQIALIKLRPVSIFLLQFVLQQHCEDSDTVLQGDAERSG